MKKTVHAFFLGALLLLVGTSLAAAADAPDPVVGDWTLNLAKSKFNPGPAPKSQTRTYRQSAQGITLIVDGITSDGTPMSQKSTFKYDGQDYPFTGAPNFDSLSLTRVDANTVSSTQKKGGKTVGTTTRKVSADGKTLTLASNGIDVKGRAYDDFLVFDKK